MDTITLRFGNECESRGSRAAPTTLDSQNVNMTDGF